ncbi:MAG TPA: carbohydrate ABC transporter permease [Tepidisphaeraceae bacterium]|jgi:ABC-type glycerol-3-phosphate transport system permease component
MTEPRTSPVKSTLLHAVLIALALLSFAPFAWLICASFKQAKDIFSSAFLPWNDLGSLGLNNFKVLFTAIPFSKWLFNSLFLASMQTVLVVTLSSLGGFSLAKYNFRGKRPLMLLMLATMLLPSQVLLPSSYELMYHLGWINSYAAILIPGAVSVFGMFLFRQAMQGVPDELLHAGRVDGCSEVRLWWEIALPIVRPMVGAFTLLAFLANWNSYLWPQIILQDQTKYTLPIGLANMVGLPQFETQYGVLMAGTLLSILPVVVLFFILQKDFIAGLASGAVKG